MELEKIERLEVEITQLNERSNLIRKGQVLSIVLLLLYGMLVSIGPYQFNGMLFTVILFLALGSSIWVHLIVDKVSKKLRECEGYL